MTHAKLKMLLVSVVSAGVLTACASAPKQIDLPLSSLKAPSESVEQSAIAFQASDGKCNKSGFKISP